MYGLITPLTFGIHLKYYHMILILTLNMRKPNYLCQELHLFLHVTL